MANNAVEVQVLRDDDRYTTLKVTGVAGSAWTATGLLLQANTLFGANASQSFCPLSLTDVKFAVDAAPAGYVAFTWAGQANSNNQTILSFGGAGGQAGVLSGQNMFNNANTPSGDVQYVVNNLGAGNTFNFILTFAKDQSPLLGVGFNGNVALPFLGNPVAWANTTNAYNVPWA